MKTGILSFLLLVLVSLVACEKEVSQKATALTASKNMAIKKGEPVLFTMVAKTAVTWHVYPSAGVQITANGNQASIRFATAGNYSVMGISGTDSASIPVVVADSIYQGSDSTNVVRDSSNVDTVYVPPVVPHSDTLAFSSGETLQLTPAIMDTNSTTGLLITAITTKSYACGANSLPYRFNNSGNEYQLTYPGVLVPYGCATGAQRAATLEPIMLYPVAAGAHPFSVVANGKAYVGTLTKSGDTYTFTWPYSSGVTISPLVVK